MKDYNYVSQKLQEKINTPKEFHLKFVMMCHALGIENTDQFGEFKDMDRFFQELTMAFLDYCRENKWKN